MHSSLFFLHKANNCLSFLKVLNACVIVLFVFSHVYNSGQCNAFSLIKKEQAKMSILSQQAKLRYNDGIIK